MKQQVSPTQPLVMMNHGFSDAPWKAYDFRVYCSGSLEAEACRPVRTCDRHHAILFRSAGPFGGSELCYRLSRFHGHMTLCIAVIGTSDQPCWLAEACKILLLLLSSGSLLVIVMLVIAPLRAASFRFAHIACGQMDDGLML